MQRPTESKLNPENSVVPHYRPINKGPQPHVDDSLISINARYQQYKAMEPAQRKKMDLLQNYKIKTEKWHKKEAKEAQKFQRSLDVKTQNEFFEKYGILKYICGGCKMFFYSYQGLFTHIRLWHGGCLCKGTVSGQTNHFRSYIEYQNQQLTFFGF